MVTVDFDDGFNTKVCSVDNIIIVDMMMARKTIVFLVRYLFIRVRGSG